MFLQNEKLQPYVHKKKEIHKIWKTVRKKKIREDSWNVQNWKFDRFVEKNGKIGTK